MEKRYLLTPGPTPLPEEVRAALAKTIIHHRTSEFQEILTQVNAGLKYIFQTKNDVFTFAASGTGAMEAAVVNLLSAEDKAIVVCAGKFGERWRELCNTYNVQAIVIDVEWGRAVPPNEIKRLLSQHRDIKAVFTTSCETSTGVVHDIEAIGAIVKDTPAVLVVDAISALGAEDIQTDNWHLDCVVAGSQKGLMLPPGLAFCSISTKAWALIKEAKLPRYYFDWQKAKKALDKNDTPFTPAISLVVALKEALSLIQKEGLEQVFKRHKIMAQATREALRVLGFQIFAQTLCNVVTAAYVPSGINSSELVKLMRTKYGVSITDGQAQLKGKIIRLAHLGYIQPSDILVGISTLEKALSELGHPLGSAKGVQAAEAVFSQSKKE